MATLGRGGSSRESPGRREAREGGPVRAFLSRVWPQMQRAMARQAESERERRAKIIAAEGEYQASERLRQAADRLESPTALQLRLFQTMGEIAVNQNSTIILPVPIDLIRPFLDSRDGTPEGGARTAQREEEEAERLYEEAVGEVSPQASPDEVRPEREPT
jgi:hypothetical protein